MSKPAPARAAVIGYAAILILTMTLLLLSANPAQGTESGQMSGVTLSSNTPGQLTISWDAPNPTPNDYRIRWARNDLDFLSYSVANETQRGNKYPKGGVTSLTLTGLDKGATYKVQARTRHKTGGQGNGPWSGPWSGVFTARVKNDPPAAPASLTATATGSTTMTLTWTAPAHSNIAGYRVWKGETADQFQVATADTGSDATTWNDTGLSAGTTYHYKVAAISPDGLGAESAIATATTLSVSISAPTGLSATADDHASVTLSWTAPDDRRTTGYRIWRNQGLGDSVVIEEDTGTTTTTFTDNSVTASGQYSYHLAALDSSTVGTHSTSVSVTVPEPGFPARILAGNFGNTESTITLSAETTQRFETGDNRKSYEITGVTVKSADTDADQFTVAIYRLNNDTVDTSDSGSLVATLTAPDSFAAGEIEFSASGGVTLDGRTTYALVVTPTGDPIDLKYASAKSLTLGSQAGWSIDENDAGTSLSTDWKTDDSDARLIFRITGRPHRARSEAPDHDLPTHADTEAMIVLNRASRAFIPGGQQSRDQDWFAVHLEKGQSYTLFLMGEKGANCTVMAPIIVELRDPSGERINSSLWSNRNSNLLHQLAYTASHTGEHHLVATSDISVGEYGLGTYLAGVIRGSDAGLMSAIGKQGCPPLKPENLLGNIDGTSATLTWTAPAHDAITGYRVYRAVGDGNYGNRAEVGSTSTTYTDSGLRPGTPHRYAVRALSAAGDSNLSAFFTLTPPVPRLNAVGSQSGRARSSHDVAPGKPIGFSAEAGTHGVRLQWTTPSGQGIQHYQIRRGPTLTNLTRLVTILGGTAYFEDTTLSPNTTYYYSITATNSHGTGPAATLKVTTLDPDSTPENPNLHPIIAPLTPTTLAAEILATNKDEGIQRVMRIGPVDSGNTQEVAIGFTSGTAHFTHGLTGVTLRLLTTVTNPSTSGIEVSLWSDGSNAPSKKLATFENPVDLSDLDTGYRSFDFLTPYNTVLAPETTYWIVISSPDLALMGLASGADTEGPETNRGWKLADQGRVQNAKSPGWSSINDVVRITIHGIPFSHTNEEPDDWDFPGVAHTWGLLTITDDASGKLTDPEDTRNAGYQGDSFVVQMQPHKRYRVRATLGTSPTQDQAGGVETYGNSGAWDHYRNDGRLFFDLETVHTSQIFAINVQSRDFYNGDDDEDEDEDDELYTGDYTVTLTDITDFRKQIGNYYQTTGNAVNVGTADSEDRWIAASFQTGTNTGGYTLGWIDVMLEAVSAPSDDDNEYGSSNTPQIELWSNQSDLPHEKIFEFDAPHHINNMPDWYGPSILIAPETTAADLAASTKYWIVFKNTEAETVYAGRATTVTTVDSGAATGWTKPSAIVERDPTDTTPAWASITDAGLVFDVFAKKK